ncbi:MAG TPA: glycosyltransferase family 4 protein [Candidatus Saccharimonadales bacterium]|nr:glycosyltransferase family 4 protein [Candidatus Saccharimonadales bacterium]
MKIIIVIPYFYPSIGGLQNYALNIAKGLQKLQHEVIIITTNHKEKKYLIETIENLKVYRLPISFVISNTPINIKWFNYIYTIIEKEKPDIVNGHTPVPFIAEVAAFVTKIKKIPFVMTYQNDLIKDNIALKMIIGFYYFLFGIPALNISTKIIASSQYYVKNSEYLKKYQKKIEIISPGVHLEEFSESSLNKNKLKNIIKQYTDKKILLFIGQLDKTHEHKGLSYLITSLVDMRKKNEQIHLLVIGKGNNIQKYKGLVTQLQLVNNVTFVGFVSDDDLPYYYNKADIVVLPSYNKSEGFGMVLIEAGASKKPVVASAIGGIPYVVKDGVTGFLTKPKDSTSLYKAILTILNDNALSKKMGNNNYKWVQENFTWDKQIEKTNILFKNLTL